MDAFLSGVGADPIETLLLMGYLFYYCFLQWKLTQMVLALFLKEKFLVQETFKIYCKEAILTLKYLH